VPDGAGDMGANSGMGPGGSGSSLSRWRARTGALRPPPRAIPSSPGGRPSAVWWDDCGLHGGGCSRADEGRTPEPAEAPLEFAERDPDSPAGDGASAERGPDRSRAVRAVVLSRAARQHGNRGHPACALHAEWSFARFSRKDEGRLHSQAKICLANCEEGSMGKQL
jgi:hypothetical protein